MANLTADKDQAARWLVLLMVELLMNCHLCMDFDRNVVESIFVDTVPELGGQADERRHQLILRSSRSLKFSSKLLQWDLN